MAVVAVVVAGVGGAAVMRRAEPATGAAPPHVGHHADVPAALATSTAPSTQSCPPMTDGGDVTIAVSCVIDRDVTAGDVVVSGDATVSVADEDLTLTVRSLKVMGGGRFLAGCPTPLTSRLRIRITDDGNRDAPGMGTGVIGGMDGDFCLVGAYDGPGFSPLAGTVRAGATSVTTKQPLRVRPGQRIVLATTDRDLDHSETVTVTAVSADGRELSVEPAIRYEHLCTERSYQGGKSITMCGDAAALDRNIEVSPVDGAVGHMMFMGAGDVQVSGVHLDRMGYAKARYGGVHFHGKGDAPGSFMARNSCTNSGARCFVIHATNESFMVDNVAFDTECSAILAGEDGVETGNVYRHNLALNTHPCDLDDFDGGSAGPSGIWSAAADQTFIDNHVAGNIGWGFHMDTGRFDRPRGISASKPVSPREAHVGTFVGFTAYSILEGPVAHRCAEFKCGAGLFIDMDGRVDGCWPDQRNEDWRCGDGTAAYPYYSFGRNNMFHDVTVWNVDSAGVWGGRGFGLRNLAVADTRDGVWLADGHADDSLIVGNTGAVVNPPQSRQCTRIYDFKTVVTDSTFANCGAADGGGAIDTNGSTTDAQPAYYGVSAFKNLTLDNSRPFYAHEGEKPDRCQQGNGTFAWLLDDSTGYGPGHLEFGCGPGTGVTEPDWNGVKVVTADPSLGELHDGTRQHGDPNVVGIPDLPGRPSVPDAILPD